LTNRQINEQLDAFLKENGALSELTMRVASFGRSALSTTARLTSTKWFRRRDEQ
jgi:hypothetical protein